MASALPRMPAVSPSCRHDGMQVCKLASLQACKHASMSICLDVIDTALGRLEAGFGLLDTLLIEMPEDTDWKRRLSFVIESMEEIRDGADQAIRSVFASLPKSKRRATLV
jgi:hypothetical protein